MKTASNLSLALALAFGFGIATTGCAADSPDDGMGDDGTGGADPAKGSGLIGLDDRIQALGGTLVVESPVGEGTTLSVSLPVT